LEDFRLNEDGINKAIEQIRLLNEEKEIRISNQEKKIELQKATAINSSRLASLGEMAGNIAHEINNPLAIIMASNSSMSRMVMNDTVDRTSFKKNSDIIAKTIERISRIIESLRNIARDSSAEPKRFFAVKEALQDVLSLCSERFKMSHIDIQCDIDDPVFLTMIEGKSAQVSQSFLNVLNNSFDNIQFKTSKWVKILGERKDGWIYIKVIDSGNGIPDKFREKLFQPFFTTKDIGQGTGLGLSFAYSIMKDHGGEIYYDETEKNTCFVIKLPVVQRT